MNSEKIANEYFNWMYHFVAEKRFAKSISFRKLLMTLHTINFRYSIPNDENREEDGFDLRYRFAIYKGHEKDPDDILDALTGPCSVLEMMIALAIRCEENIMDDPAIGNRTSQWFWGMITNLGLGGMMDDRFDKEKVIDIVDRFLDRRYEPNGRGGLFTVRSYPKDLREVEIWYQMCWYLDTIV